LNLGSNAISDDGAKHIGEVMKYCTNKMNSLKEKYFHGNLILQTAKNWNLRKFFCGTF